MKTLFRVIIFVYSIVTLSALAEPPATPNNSSLTTEIIRILNKSNPDTDIGISITDVKTGQVIFSRRANFLFKPASIQKLFTAVAALNYLTPNYRFSTELLSNGEIRDRTLRGDLTVRFTGDPELTADELRALIARLKILGIHQIQGRVFIDNTAYSSVPYPPGWLWDDLSYGYAAPLNAIIINRNKFVLHLVPAEEINQPPKLYPIMPAGILNFTNRAKTVAHHDSDCPLTIFSDANNHYTISGCINRGRQFRTLAIRDPLPYAAVLIQQALQDNAIRYERPITARRTPANAIVLEQHLSPPLSVMLKEMLKTSDNLTTDSLLNKLGQLYFKRQGTWHNGLRALRKILEPTGIDFKRNLINDGAGLSRYNLVSPHQFTQLLRFAYRNDAIRTPLLDALPIAGKDGTLIYRMPSAAPGERVHAKTGSMTGISALAGYVRTRHHGVLSFVIIANGFVGKYRPYRHLEDKICELLVHHQGRIHG